jgi:hypothetical protein
MQVKDMKQIYDFHLSICHEIYPAIGQAIISLSKNITLGRL